MPGPLHGYRVVDLTSMISGPLATMILADQGADVIKVENPDGGDTPAPPTTGAAGIGVLPEQQPQQAIGRAGPQGPGREAGAAAAGRRRMFSSKISAPASSTGWAWARRRCGR